MSTLIHGVLSLSRPKPSSHDSGSLRRGATPLTRKHPTPSIHGVIRLSPYPSPLIGIPPGGMDSSKQAISGGSVRPTAPTVPSSLRLYPKGPGPDARWDQLDPSASQAESPVTPCAICSEIDHNTEDRALN